MCFSVIGQCIYGHVYVFLFLTGFYMTIDATYPQEFKRAELFTPFIQATEADVCLQFAYSMRGLPGDMGTLSVNQLYPQGVVRIVWSNRVLTQTEWDLKVLNLGLGIFQVVFEATLGNGPLGDIALDDIIIGPCRKFGKYSPFTLSSCTSSSIKGVFCGNNPFLFLLLFL